MSKLIFTLCCMCLPLVWAEDAPASIGKWESALEKEIQTLAEHDAQMAPPAAFREAGQAAVKAAERLRAAQIAFGDECIYLYADLYRPEQGVIENMQASFAAQVDACLLQDLRSIILYCPWCHTNDKAGYWLRTPEDAALWLKDFPAEQPAPLSGLFSARNNRNAGHLAITQASTLSCRTHQGIVKLCAQEIAALYNGGMAFEPLSGAQTLGSDVRPKDIQRLLAAFQEAEQAWDAYCESVSRLVFPQHGDAAQGSTQNMYIERVLNRLCASHMQYLTFVSNGVQSDLNITPRYGVFHLSAGQQRHAFGEIFHDYAMFFRHPAQAGNPWCMTMGGPSTPDAEFSYVRVAPCPELDAYAASHPEGGMVFVHGYVDVEVTGKPYEPINRPADADGNIPDPRPEDAYNLQAVLRVISLMPLKW